MSVEAANDDRMSALDARAAANRLEYESDDTLNFQIVTLSNKLSLTVARRALAADGLTLREWRILMVLFLYGPSMAREIADRALLDAAHVSRTVRQLEEDGRIDLSRNRADRRQMIARLTEEGEELARRVLPRVLAINDSFREIFTDDEYETLIGLLERANRHADRVMSLPDLVET